MTFVKICGITNLKDASSAARFGADQLGFNFYAKSPRYISPENAGEIVRQLPATVQKVGVFVDADLKSIAAAACVARLDAVQLHGDESPGLATAVRGLTRLPVIKAFRVSENFAAEDVTRYEVDAILLDAYSAAEFGGTGETFNWETALKVKNLVPRLYLAGGLSVDNVARAIAEVRPFCVDACSRLESEKGIKDELKLRGFLMSAGKSI